VAHTIALPTRPQKPRIEGITMVIDSGLPTAQFTDLVSSFGNLIDFVKFGWGTSVVSPNIEAKIAAARQHGVDFYLGGTLFEKYVIQNRFDEFRGICHEYGATTVEVSNGTAPLSHEEKAAYVEKLAADFRVVAEVGFKDNVQSENFPPKKWIQAIRRDLDAGAYLVTLETRESGKGGICRPNGELRYGLIEEILDSGIEANQLMFEAPTNELQGYFVKRVGTNVNLGNIASDAVVSCETIRLGLRSETLLEFESKE
jgi:phosphosulfolactate synthase